MNAIEVRGLSKTYDDFRLDKLDLNLPEGCIMGLVGENGAGKSTTIKLIMNAIRADAGSVAVLGEDNRGKAFLKLKEDIGVVLDEAYFPEVLNAVNVNLVMRNTFMNWDEKKYYSFLERFSLPEKKQFKDFSRGMKMKFAISVALSHNPRLLILDEATSGLDPMIRDEILDIFNDFTREENHSVLLSSHIVSDLEKICDYIAFLHKGKLVFCEEKDMLLEKYGLLRLSKSDFEAVPEKAVMGKKVTGYGVEALVLRDAVPASFPQERPGIEDIILFMARGENK